MFLSDKQTHIPMHTPADMRYPPLKDTGFAKVTSVGSGKVQDKTGGGTENEIKFPIFIPQLPSVWMDSVDEETDGEYGGALRLECVRTDSLRRPVTLTLPRV